MPNISKIKINNDTFIIVDKEMRDILSSSVEDNGKVLTVKNGVASWSDSEPICIFDVDEEGGLFSTTTLPVLPTAEEGVF